MNAGRNSGLRVLLEQVRVDLTARRYRREYEVARGRYAAFAPHASIADLLTVLDDNAPSTYPEREAITVALLDAHTEGDSWSACALLVAFRPMLLMLRRRIYPGSMPDADVDQLVVMGFVSALPKARTCPDRMALRLRQATQRHVFRALRKDRAQDAVVIKVCAENEGAVEAAMSVRDEPTPRPDNALRRVLRSAVSHGSVSEETARVILATLHETLRSYVERVVPEPREREAVYQRWKRRRTRALRRLRVMMARPADQIGA